MLVLTSSRTHSALAYLRSWHAPRGGRYQLRAPRFENARDQNALRNLLPSLSLRLPTLARQRLLDVTESILGSEPHKNPQKNLR